MKFLAICTLLLFFGHSIAAQTLVRDLNTGNYHLTYTDLDGVTHTILVEAVDQVAPLLRAVVQPTPAVLVYRYELTHLVASRARTPIMSMEIPCPAATSVSAPPTWNSVLLAQDRVCDFSSRIGHRLKPGETVQDLVITSTWLPTIADVKVSGPSEGVQWASEAGSVPNRAYELAHSVNGRNGGWYSLKAVAPGRDPAGLTSASGGLEWLSADLARSCTLKWIPHAGVCQSLRVKLENLRKSLDRGSRDAAGGQIAAFLQELEAQRGKHVDDNAYSLLKVIAEATRQRF